jgi:predicted component of type VI protein secretion system
MTTDLNYFPVNWVDGMKISRRHFEQNELFVHDALRDVTAMGLTNYSYGILPLPSSLQVQINCDYNKQIQVKLISCRALMPNGLRVELLHHAPLSLQVSFEEIAEKHRLQTAHDQQLEVVLTVNPFHRIPVGEPVLDEMPPRHPYTRPDWQLTLVPEGQLNAGNLSNSLIIGRILFRNGELQPLTDYLPACTAVNSLAPLREWSARFENYWDLLGSYAARVVQKTKDKSQRTDLILSIGALALGLLEVVSSHRLSMKWRIPQQAPIHLLELLLQPVQTLQTFLNCQAPKEKEELLNYLGEWMDLLPGAFENQLRSLLQLQYAHTELASLLAELDAFYKTLMTAFFKLSQLEYIGKRKGQNVFIIENQAAEQKPAELPKTGRWSPI